MKYNIFSGTLVEFRWNLEANMFCLTWTCLNVTQYVRSDPEQEEYHVTMQYGKKLLDLTTLSVACHTLSHLV